MTVTKARAGKEANKHTYRNLVSDDDRDMTQKRKSALLVLTVNKRDSRSTRQVCWSLWSIRKREQQTHLVSNVMFA